MIKKFILLILLVGMSTVMHAQRVLVSTDLLKWGTLSPNLSADILLSPRFSLNVEGVFNPIVDIGLKQAGVSTELRFWFKRFSHSHYLGLNPGIFAYELRYKDDWFKGQMTFIGLSYGYSFILSRRFSLTPSIGYGYGYVRSYTHPELGVLSPVRSHFKPVLTRIGLSLSYIIN